MSSAFRSAKGDFQLSRTACWLRFHWRFSAYMHWQDVDRVGLGGNQFRHLRGVEAGDAIPIARMHLQLIFFGEPHRRDIFGSETSSAIESVTNKNGLTKLGGRIPLNIRLLLKTYFYAVASTSQLLRRCHAAIRVRENPAK